MRFENFLAPLLALSLFLMPCWAQESLPPMDADPQMVAVANNSTDIINTTSTSQWISLDSRNGVFGKLGLLNDAGNWVSQPGVVVSLNLNGRVIASSVSDVEGQFHLANVRPGSYSFAAKSSNSFAMFGVHIFAHGTELPASMEVTASRINPTLARSIVRDHWVPNAGSSDYYRVLPADPLGADRKVVGSKVRLVDGNLVGRVSRPGWPFSDQDLTGNVAHVIHRGAMVATAAVSRDGTFTIKNLNPGVYDLMVAGDDGVAALGFEAVGPEPLARKMGKEGRLISAQASGDSLNIELGNPADAMTATSTEEVPGIPVEGIDPGMGIPFGGGFPGGGGLGGGGGGLSGGGSGGGGLGGGGGGIGGLLGIAGLAAGVAALSQDDSFNANLATDIAPPLFP